MLLMLALFLGVIAFFSFLSVVGREKLFRAWLPRLGFPFVTFTGTKTEKDEGKNEGKWFHRGDSLIED